MTTTVSTPTPFTSAKVRSTVQALQPDLVAWRRQIHQYPELGFKEHLTSEFIAKKLEEWGIDHQTKIAKTGIVAIIEGKQPGPVLAIRADMDALPIQEENEVSYKSCHQGVMHACGHDGHTAIALGTTYYLSQHKQDFYGTVKIIFQPAEEGPGGAKPMIEAGVLKNPDVEAIIGLHLWNNLPVGIIGVGEDAIMAAVDIFDCTIFGRGGHGAMPHQTIDAILVGSQIVNNLQTIVSRNIDPLESAVVTIGYFQGGDTYNVIADKVQLKGTVRHFNPKLKEYFHTRIEQIIAGICQSHNATYKLNYQHIYPAVINEKSMSDLVKSVAESVVETPAGLVPKCQTMGGEDMSFFLQEVPGCYFFLGSADFDRNLSYPHHHPRFDFDEKVLSIGVEMFVRCVEKFFDAPHHT